MTPLISTSELIVLITSGAVTAYVIISNIKLWKESKKEIRSSRENNKTAMILSALVSLVFYVIAVSFFFHPMQTFETKSLGEMHYWVAGVLFVMLGGIFDLLATLGFLKMQQNK